MSLHGDLLDQAQHLARREPRKPKQASLRRAVSTAYYALFHLLVKEASAMVVKEESLRHLVGRAFAHDDLKHASQAFANATLPPHVLAVAGSPPSAELRQVAGTLVALQDARHEADYKVNRTFTRKEANHLVDRGLLAFQAWKNVRKQPIGRIYLASLLLWKKWK